MRKIKAAGTVNDPIIDGLTAIASAAYLLRGPSNLSRTE
jgi:hypothetical protein